MDNENGNNPGGGEKADVLDRVVAVMAAHTALPAGVIAEKAGLAYSTTTPKLRALEQLGRAERIRVDGRTLWRLTADGPTIDATAEPDPTTSQTAEPEPETDPAAVPDGHATTGPEEPTDAPAPDGPTDVDSPPVGPAVAAPAREDEVRGGEEVPVDDEVSVRDEVGVDADAAPDPGRETQHDDAQASPVQPVEADPDEAADLADNAEPADAVPAEPVPATAHDAVGAAATRRPKGVLRAAVLEILHAHPDTAYKVGELSKLLGGASAGAIANALTKLAAEGTLIQTVDKPATFQAV